MYQFSSRIRFSETDRSSRLDPASLLNYFQDCVTFHSQAVGLSHAALMERGMFWVLNAWNVVITRLPALCEEVTVITNPYDFKACFGKRNFRMETADGETLAVADSLWTLLSAESGAPVACDPSDILRYGPGEAFDMDYAHRKVKIAGELVAEFEPVTVGRGMIDYNGHVNNVQYVRLALQYLPELPQLHQLRVEYRRAALLGDVMQLQLYRDGERHVLSMTDTEGKLYAAVELR